MGCRTGPGGVTGAVPGGDANGFSTTMMYDGFNEAGSWAQVCHTYPVLIVYDCVVCRSQTAADGQIS